ncbi:MAG: carbon monoxide dehydrogenase subunit G [Anaerolineae bacterium]
MRLEGEYVFDGPRDDVWELVREPEVLATALPGTQSLDQVSESEYQGKMHIRVGPVAGVFSGRIVVSDEVPPESCTLTVEGRGSPGFVNGTGHIQLIDQGDDTTLMQYEGDIQVGGRLASVGQRLIDTVSKSMIRQGLEALNQALQARKAANSGGQEEGQAYKAPSEAEFAAAVARDVAGQVLSPSRLLWIAIGAVIVIAILAVILISRGGG